MVAYRRPVHARTRAQRVGGNHVAEIDALADRLEAGPAMPNQISLLDELRAQYEAARKSPHDHADVPGFQEIDKQLRTAYRWLERAFAYLDGLKPPIEHRFDLQWLASDLMPERLTLQQFHGDEGSPIGLINLVDRADVRVVQRGSSLGFPLETAKSLCVVGELVGKEFQGDVATELEVFGLVDHAHAPAPDLAEYAVMGNRLSHGLGGRRHWREC